MRPWHVVINSASRLRLFASEADQRDAVRALARIARRALVFFCISDDHVHLVLEADLPERRRLSQAIGVSLTRRSGLELAPAWYEPVTDRRHLIRLLKYVLKQPIHHDLPGHPALWPGSCFPDLVGARVLPGLTVRLSELLPRFDPRLMYEHVGLEPVLLRPMAATEIRTRGAFALTAAAGAALAVHPDLPGVSGPVVTARRAVALLARAAGIGGADVAAALRVSRRTGRRLARAEVPARVLDAVRLRMALEARADTESAPEAEEDRAVPSRSNRR